MMVALASPPPKAPQPPAVAAQNQVQNRAEKTSKIEPAATARNDDVRKVKAAKYERGLADVKLSQTPDRHVDGDVALKARLVGTASPAPRSTRRARSLRLRA